MALCAAPTVHPVKGAVLASLLHHHPSQGHFLLSQLSSHGMLLTNRAVRLTRAYKIYFLMRKTQVKRQHLQQFET